jgi:ubiquitin thioesterase CYLD
MLVRKRNDHDIPQHPKVQKVLREAIVNPLRENLYVSSERVMELRNLLDELSSVRGLTSEEKGNNTEMPLRCYHRNSAV